MHAPPHTHTNTHTHIYMHPGIYINAHTHTHTHGVCAGFYIIIVRPRANKLAEISDVCTCQDAPFSEPCRASVKKCHNNIEETLTHIE